ncbi:hypothetical protein [Microbulbifer taiwanensis]|uniref:hypothetical protein n=1 Tax=Microbulbifer taiwanensis TaxID=986746 RepID=UPI00360BAB2B
MAALVKQTPGAIGYVEYGFAKLVELPVAELQNRAGNFVAPGAESGSAALENVEFPDGKLPGSGAPNLVAWEWDPEGKTPTRSPALPGCSSTPSRTIKRRRPCASW